MKMRVLLLVPVCVFALQGCALTSWHCTKGGQWSSYYASGDGRCTYFCADAEEQYCASTPLMAEQMQSEAHLAELRKNPDFIKFLEQQEQEMRVMDRDACGELGFRDGTDAMAMCMLTKSQNRREDSIFDHQAFENAHRQQLEQQKEQRKAITESIDRVQESLNTPAPVTCTTYGNTTTCR